MGEKVDIEAGLAAVFEAMKQDSYEIHVIGHKKALDRLKKENSALKKQLAISVDGLNTYIEKCYACSFPGEEEYRANGCPSCDCLEARYALKQIEEMKK